MGSNVSTQPCPDEKKKDTPVTDSDFTVACIHRSSPACLSEPFEIVPAKDEQFEEKITIDWTGKNPPVEITSDNLGKAKGNPYKLEKPYLLKDGGAGNYFWSLFTSCWTYADKDVSKINIPGKGELTVITYNPTSWSVEVTFPLPTDKARKQKGGYKFDSNTKGIRTEERTHETETRNGSTSFTQTDKKSADLTSTKTEIEITDKNSFKTSTVEEKREWDEKAAAYKDSSSAAYTEIGRTKNTLTKTDRAYEDGKLVTKGTTKKEIADELAPKTIKANKTASFYNKVGITVKKDNDHWSCDLLSVVNTAITIYQKIEEFKKILEDVPKIGWYFDWELEVLQGKFSAAWGWKEYTNHRAYFNLSLDSKITVFGIKGELGFGVSGFSFKLQAFASIGGSLSLGLNGTNNKPLKEGTPLAITAVMEGEIEFTVGARFEALYMVKMEATLKSGIKGTCEVKNDNKSDTNELAFGLTAKFNGLTANIQASVDAGASLGTRNKVAEIKAVKGQKNAGRANDERKAAAAIGEAADEHAADIGESSTSHGASKSVELIKPFNFYEGTWPQKELPKAEADCTDKQIRQIIGDILQDKYDTSARWVRSAIVIARPATWDEIEHRKFLFLTWSRKDYVTEVSNDDIAAELTQILLETPYILKSKKAVEAIGLAIRKEFERITEANENSVIEFSLVLYSDYRDFLRTTYKDILNSNIDQAKAILAVNKP